MKSELTSGELKEGKRYQFVVMTTDIYKSFEITSKYPKNGYITLVKFQSFCNDIYAKKDCIAVQEKNGFTLLFYGKSKYQDALEVFSLISNQLDFFNKSISLIPYNIEIRNVIGINSLIYQSKSSRMIDPRKNPMHIIKDKTKANEILITDSFYNELSRDQKRYFYFKNVYENYIVFKAGTTFLFNNFITEANNVIRTLEIIAEKLRYELKNFSKDSIERLIEIYRYIDLMKTLNNIALECSDLEFFSKNITVGYNFLYKLKEIEKIVSDVVGFATERFTELVDNRLIIVFTGIYNQLEWFFDVELKDEIERLDFILANYETKKSSDKSNSVFESKQKEGLKLINKLVAFQDSNKLNHNVKKLIHLHFDQLVYFLVISKHDENSKNEHEKLIQILWEHLYLFCNNSDSWSKKHGDFSYLNKTLCISKKFENYLLLLAKNDLFYFKKMLAGYNEKDRCIVAKSLFFHNNKMIADWSIKNVEITDLWELVASQDTPLKKMWEILGEISRREETSDFDKVLFFTCAFERIKKDLISAKNVEDILVIENFLKEFLKSGFYSLEHYHYRVEELRMIYMHKLEVLGKSENIFKRFAEKTSQALKNIFILPFSNSSDNLYNTDRLRKLKPWVQLHLAKHGFFPIYFICQQNDLSIAKAALKKLNPSQIPQILMKGFLNYDIFFLIADMRKFFTRSSSIKALLKHKLANEKHYKNYKKFLSDGDLKEIKCYSNTPIKKLIENDLKKK